MSYYTGSTQPGPSDGEHLLLLKSAQSLFATYGETGSASRTGPVRPQVQDTIETLLRKIAQMLHDNL